MVAARVSRQAAIEERTRHTTPSDVTKAVTIPKAPFYGSKVVELTDLNKVFDFINETALFKGQWQYKQGRKSAAEYAEILEKEVYPRFREVKAQAIREKLLEAKLAYGYFPCRSEGNDLIILNDDESTERLRFTFPRQPLEQRGSKNLCLADYFASDRTDVVAFQLVTMGRKASEHSHRLFKSDNYTDYLLFHGLSVEAAEALAELWHKRVREELGIAGDDSRNSTSSSNRAIRDRASVSDIRRALISRTSRRSSNSSARNGSASNCPRKSIFIRNNRRGRSSFTTGTRNTSMWE
ncbi:MAG: hypothetical protein IPK58_07560 [Acidobacteria bacterium]|nr:hypothetical protein [Acidobacteriota bacterium]